MTRGALASLLGSARTREAARALVPLAAVLALGVIFNASGAFFEWQTHRSLLREIAVHGMLACGMTVVIVSAGIDLSVGSLLGLGAVAFSLLTLQLAWPPVLAFAAVLALGTALGAASGAFVAFFSVPSFVVTLAMMVFARGLAKELSGGQKVSTYVKLDDGSFRTLPEPAIFSALDAKVLGGNLSVVTLLFAATAMLTWLLLRRLRVGRYVYAVGGNFEAARLSGVPVRATLLVVYAWAGLCAALAGICQAAQELQGDPETGAGYELDAIAMVVLGGTSLSGGRGSVSLTLVGVLTLGYLQKVLSLNAYSSELRLMLTGLILLAAVLFQRRFRSAER